MNKSFLVVLLFFLFAISCKSDQKNDNNETAKQKKESPYQYLRDKTPLTDEKLLSVLPNTINSFNQVTAKASFKGQQEVTGGYGTGYGNMPYFFFIRDAAAKRSLAVKTFYDSYNSELKGPEETEYIKKERDGYKTIAFLQHKIKRNKIYFIYNNRFRITLEGPDSADELWSYIDFDNLKKLEQY